MTIQKISQGALRTSRFAERVVITEGQSVSTPLVRVVADEQEARAWRVTLGRVDRKDQAAPLVPGSAAGSSLLFRSSLYSYAAGKQFTPANPPSRDNPVARATPPANDLDPVFVEIAWGMSTGAINRMLAHWPMQGASIVLYGSYVEVFAGTHLIYGVTSQADIPFVQASIVPEDGLAVAAAGELSIQQVDTIPTPGAFVLFVPDFAREVRVVVTPNLILTDELFHAAARLEWYDDRVPEQVDHWIQGTTGPSAGPGVIGLIEPGWQKVPSQATMLRVVSPGARTGQPVYESAGLFVHWRLAP